MEKKNSYIYYNVFMLFIAFFIFTNYIYDIQAPVIVALPFIAILIFKMSGFLKINLYIEDITSMIYILCLFFNDFIAQNTKEALRYSVLFIALLVLKIFLQKGNVWIKNCIKWMLLFSSVHVIMTLFYPITPKFVSGICKLILSSDKFSNNINMFEIQGINCGITPIQGLNAFYISIFIGIIFSYIITEKKINIVRIIYLAFGFIALFFTSKRGLLISNIIAIIFTSFILGKFKLKKNTIKTVIAVVIFSVFIYFIVEHYFNGATIIFERFTNQEDISTGRFDMYKKTWNLFIKHPIIGNGLFSNRYILDNNDAHNIYLQLLSEVGIIGFVLFLLIALFNLTKTLKKVKYAKKLENKCFFNVLVFGLYFQVFFLAYGMTGNTIFDMTMLLCYFIAISISSIRFITEKEKGEFN